MTKKKSVNIMLTTLNLRNQLQELQYRRDKLYPEELDENALKELEQMEKGDIEDMTEEEEQNKKYKNNHYQKKNFNKRPKYPDTKNKPAENFSGKKGKHYNRERDNNNYRHNNNNNNNQPRKNYHKSSGGNGGYGNGYNNIKPE